MKSPPMTALRAKSSTSSHEGWLITEIKCSRISARQTKFRVVPFTDPESYGHVSNFTIF